MHDFLSSQRVPGAPGDPPSDAGTSPQASLPAESAGAAPPERLPSHGLHGVGRLVQARETGLYRVYNPTVLDEATVARLVATDPHARRVRARGQRPPYGELVGVRLNLDIVRLTGVPVLTLHRGSTPGNARVGRGFWGGEEIWYEAVVTLRNAFFSVDQSGRERIAGGAPRRPVASVDGELARGHKFQGIEVRFNPALEHLFVDAQGNAIRWAEEVTVCGHRVYARGLVEYHDTTTAPVRKPGAAPTRARVRL